MRPEVKVGLIVGFVAIVGGSFLWLTNGSNELDSLPLDKQTVDASSSGGVKHSADERESRPVTGARAIRDSLTKTRDRNARPTKPPATAQRRTPRPGQRPTPKPKTTQAPGEEKLGSRFTPRGGASDQQPSTAGGAAAKPLPEATDKQPVESLTDEKTTLTPGVKASNKTPAATERRTPVGADKQANRFTRPATPARASRPKTIKIQPGDYLITIAENEYGDGALWPAIKAANPGLDENRLPVGREIKIPPKADAERLLNTGARSTEPAEKKTDQPAAKRAGRATYIVERGDTLSLIARNVLGDSKHWREIYELNRTRLDSPDILAVGMELLMPPVNKKAD